jgi:excinuclease ABC subunit C
VTREEYRKQIRGLRLVLEGKKDKLIRELNAAMQEASAAMQFEKAGRIRDEIGALKNLSLRGEVDRDVQPEVFQIEPKKGLAGLRKVLGLAKPPRSIEGMDIAHLSGQDTVASLVTFIDGLPFKPGYRRYRVKSVEGVDDFASIREVVSRRFRRIAREEGVFPDILLIDGGKGQLNAALEAFQFLHLEPPALISLAKREEEIYRPGDAEPLHLSRHAAALRLLQYVRDEAHRFAQHYHHILRRRKIEEE